MWAFASKVGVSPYRLHSLQVPPTRGGSPTQSVTGSIIDEMVCMMLMIWGRKGKTVFDLVSTLSASPDDGDEDTMHMRPATAVVSARATFPPRLITYQLGVY